MIRAPEASRHEEFLQLVLYVDGASRGNPGEAGAGVVLATGEGRRVGEISQYLGRKTNNQAEYWALLLGLRKAKRLGGRHVRVFTDSELMERQINGVYRVKDLGLREMYKRVMECVAAFSSLEVTAIPRGQNREADALANLAIERRIAKEKGEQGMRGGTDGRSSGHSAKQGARGEESPSSAGQGGP